VDVAEEANMNKLEMNIHRPLWARINAFAGLPFRTPQLQRAIIKAFKKGFPPEPLHL
jgi:hypothetical protein